MFPVSTPVKFTGKGARKGEVGAVIKPVSTENPDAVVVQWDSDQSADLVKVADLQQLGS